MEQEIYLARGIDIISLILCFHSRHDAPFCEQAAFHFCEMLQTAIEEKLGISISWESACQTGIFSCSTS